MVVVLVDLSAESLDATEEAVVNVVAPSPAAGAAAGAAAAAAAAAITRR